MGWCHIPGSCRSRPDARSHRPDDWRRWRTTPCCWRCSPARMASIPGKIAGRPKPALPRGARRSARPACASAWWHEGFGHPQSMAQSDAVVRDAAERLQAASVPSSRPSIHPHASDRARRSGCRSRPRGPPRQMMHGQRVRLQLAGAVCRLAPGCIIQRMARSRSDELSDTLKNTMLLGHYHDHPVIAGALLRQGAKPGAHACDAAYDRRAVALRSAADADPADDGAEAPMPGRMPRSPEIIQRAFEVLPNAAPFDCTHHPAMSLPCGTVDGLPVGMMLVGKAVCRGHHLPRRRRVRGRRRLEDHHGVRHRPGRSVGPAGACCSFHH